MKKLILLSIVFAFVTISFSQIMPALKNNSIVFASYPAQLQHSFDADSTLRIDTAYGYQVTVPGWLKILETPPNMFGGTFPAIDSIENALLFKCWKKEDFKTVENFENWVIKDYSLSQSPKWSSQVKMLLKKQLDEFKDLGPAYKTQLLRGNKIYDCCYIIVETSKSFIWIDFTATGTTYPKNYDKFKEILTSFKKL